MERFKSITSQRYHPIVALHTTLDCDAAVRTISTHRTLSSLLHYHLPPSISLTHNTPPTPPLWLEAVSKLDQTLRSFHKTSSHLVDSYAQALETATTVSDHDHLSTPFAVFLCVWAAEQDILRNLASIAKNAKPPQDGTAAAATAAFAVSERAQPFEEHSVYATPTPLEPRVLIVVREGSKHDEAALGPALEAVTAEYGEGRTFVIRLGAKEGDESPAAVASAIANVVRGELNSAIRDVAKYVDKLRKASRGTFRSWFGGGGAIPTRAVAETEMGMVGRENGEMEEVEMGEGVSNGNVGRVRKRVSFGSGGVRTPLFPVDSLEARTKHLGDLYMLAGRYGEALEMYRMLQTELRSLTGSAIVHEAAACEMSALALALVDGSKQGVGGGLEKAIQLYCRAGRQELAVRTTLRGMAFCLEAGYPDSAAGVLLRSIDAVLPKRPFIVGAVAGLPASGSAFVEGALAILYGACASAYGKLGKRRRASLYAFLGATRFAKLKFSKAAACVIRDVDENALLRRGVRDEVELILGKAENAEGNYTRAVGHFVHVMSNVAEHADVEVQGAAIQGFLEAAGKGAKDAMSKRWDSGAMFPLVDGSLIQVCTHDSRDDEDEEWEMLEDDVLEDAEYFENLAKRKEGENLPRRERKIESVIAELRRNKENGDNNDPGGSLEMKVKRIRELADARKKRRRADSLLLRGAVEGERLSVIVHMRNPLQFPVFVSDLSAVVSLDGECFTSVHSANDAGDESVAPVQFVPVGQITLVPSSIQTVPVEIVVTKPGTLHFLGLTWKFTVGMGGASRTDENLAAPGFCILERRGRRLNNTRRQRASEVPLYEKDESLIVRIAPPAPRLKAEIQGAGEDGTAPLLNSLIMRAGETRKVCLTLTNEGPVPLKSVVLRVGTPQTVYVNMTPDKIPHEADGALFAIGTDEDIVGEDDVIASSRLSIGLEPRKSIQLDLWLKAAVPKFAFGYRSSGSAGRRRKSIKSKDGEEETMIPCDVRLAIAYSTERVRVTRVAAQFHVQPSILVSPRFLREADESAFKDGDSGFHGILLGLEVEHAVHTPSANLAFYITEISVTSRDGWKPMLLQTPSDSHDSISNELIQSASTLRINETATIFFLVVRDNNFKRNELTGEVTKPWRTFTVSLSNGARSDQAVDVGEPAEINSTTQEKHEHRASTHFVMSAHHGSGSHIDRKVSKGELVHVGLGWKSSAKQYGKIHIPPIDPVRWMKRYSSALQADMETAYSREPSFANEEIVIKDSSTDRITASQPFEKDELQKWVSVEVRHPEVIEHDFYNKPSRPAYISENSIASPYPVVVAVDVIVHNLSSYLLDVVFTAPPSAGIADGDRGRYFAGDIAMSLRALPPGARRALNLTAIITRPGRFNLSKFTVLFQLCGYHSRGIREQVIVPPSYLTVHSATPLMSGQDPAKMGGLSPMTVIAGKSLEQAEIMGEQYSDGEKILKNISRKGEVSTTEALDGEVNRPPRPPADGYQGTNTTSRSNLKSVVDLSDTNQVVRSKTSLGLGSNKSVIMPSAFESPAERRKPLTRTRPDTSGVPARRRSVDDALWNASDTDESDG